MVRTKRGADLLVEALSAAGVKRLFTLSGNQIMSLFDASIDADIELIHVRHEAAAVHMADAWGRLTGQPGVVAVTAGPGFANTISALYVAKMAETPVVLLSGHAEHELLGRGAFQEMPQADMASHVAKASWTATDASGLGRDVVRALELASSGRPGPVHVALPGDLLESVVEQPYATTESTEALPQPLEPADISSVEAMLDVLADAARPLVLTGPAMMRGPALETTTALSQETRVPVVGMESPRGINDPSLGAFAEVLAQADLIVLLGKKLDFSLRFGDPPAIRPGCRFVQIDADEAVVEQTGRVVADSSRLVMTAAAHPQTTAEVMLDAARTRQWPASQWNDEVGEAVSYRPAEWRELESPPDGPLHAVDVCREVQASLDKGPGGVFVSDGGEFGQWAQACVSAPTRIINGTAGSIGTAVPYAMAARLVNPDAPVVTILGDGTFGFHAAEFDTAVRHGIPFVAVVGNDAAWNAEYQIQLRSYGEDRLIGCELLPTRYDEVAKAFGAHGENVTRPSELRPALERAMASGLPACVNVAIQRNPAPVVRRGS